MCEDGTQNVGCGNQEIFRSCADIRIVSGDDTSNEVSSDSGEDQDSEDTPSSEAGPGGDGEDELGPKPCILPPQNLRK